MDQIFIQLLALDEAYMLVPGLRHKSDTARRIIEATRGDITLEVRRKSLEDLLKEVCTTKTKNAKANQKRSTIENTAKLTKRFSLKKPTKYRFVYQKNYFRR